MEDQFSANFYTNSISTDISVETESIVTRPLDHTHYTQDVETLATNEVLQMYDQNYYLTAIGGVIIAILSIVVIIIGLIVCCIRHRKKNEAPTVDQSLKYGDEKTSSKFKWEALFSGSIAYKSRTKIESQKINSTNMDSKLATAMDGTVEASMLASINGEL
uniref:Uncharacterized protein n=1 Tax=Romanomermis culicivorax TaxID=13658 RepID=A0A915KTS9_ROMCU